MELREPRPTLGRRAARTLLHAVLDSGINFVDTSPDHGDSEEIIEEALQSRRDEYLLASKCGRPVASAKRRVALATRP